MTNTQVLKCKKENRGGGFQAGGSMAKSQVSRGAVREYSGMARVQKRSRR